MRELYGIYYSPWSEKARWALDYHKIEYEYHEHIPLITTPLVRLKTGNLSGRITVPLLIDGNQTIQDSYAVVRHAERIGRGERLIPFEHEAEIARINGLAERVLRASRAIITARVDENPDAKHELLPDFFPEDMKEYLLPVADLASKYLKMKYSFDGVPMEQHHEVIRQILTEVRSLLKGKETFFGRFTLADINAALMLQFVKPVAMKYIHLKPAMLLSFTQSALAREFADLVEWRDALYAKYRR